MKTTSALGYVENPNPSCVPPCDDLEGGICDDP